MLRRELTIHPAIKECFWTDSEVALGYVNNDAKCFKIFVANRVQLIQEKVSRWLNGPEFLWLGESKWTTHGKKDIPKDDQGDPEVKTKLPVHVTSAVDEGITSAVQKRISSWTKLLRVAAWVMRWIKIVRKHVNKTNVQEVSPTQLHVLSVEELIAAEVVVIKGYEM